MRRKTPIRSTEDLLRIIAVRRESKVPVSDQLFESIRRNIQEGTFAGGEPLPSTRDLARHLGLSRNTVLAAFAELQMHGLVESRVGSGTLVAESQAHDRTTSQGSRRSMLRAVRGDRDTSTLHWTMTPRPPLWLTRTQMSAIRDVARMPTEAIHDGCIESVIEHLAVRGVGCSRSEIALIDNRRHALYALARVMAKHSSGIWFEDPGDPVARGALGAGGLSAHLLPVDALGANIARSPRSSDEPRLAYVTPSHQLPLGTVMNGRRRRMLIEWAAAHDGWIIEDDAAAFLRWPVQAPLFEPGSRVIHVAPIASTFGPFAGLTCIVATEPIAAAVRTFARTTGAAPDLIAQRVITRILTTGSLQRERRRLRIRARNRDRATVQLSKSCLSWFVSQVTGTETGDRAVLWTHHGSGARMLVQALNRKRRECTALDDSAVLVDLRFIPDSALSSYFADLAADCRAILEGERPDLTAAL
jgi:GntR family transcriptional regulator/MocR family aminotransferase